MKHVSVALVLALVGCDAPDPSVDAAVRPDAPRDAGPPLGPYPTVEALPELDALPSLFTSYDGTRTATTVADWQGWRRDELRDLLSFYLYGYVPERSVTVTATVATSVPDFVPGVVAYTEHELTLGDLGLTLHVALYTPVGIDDPPVFIAPNRCGNQEVSTDPRLRATTGWVAPDCGADAEASRGVRAAQWPIETIVRAGFAFAAFHEAEIDPDDEEDDFANGVHAVMTDEARDPRLRWGRIAAWAWGISRIVDWLETSTLVDPDRIAVVGHSRRGKTALVAGAFDERIAMVIAHQSGTGGAALTRHLAGEPVGAVNLLFPSWFDDVFPTFEGEENRIPVDQHMLIALSAPRLVLLTDGEDDAWADPDGATMAAEAASAAWDLYDVPGLVEDASGPTLDGNLGRAMRPGVHELTHADWDVFLDFARRHWPAP